MLIHVAVIERHLLGAGPLAGDQLVDLGEPKA
jgi:hypothetical protein